MPVLVGIGTKFLKRAYARDQTTIGARLTELGNNNSAMDNRTEFDDEIKTAEQHETLKQMLLRLLDDPQIQQKIGAFLRRSGFARSTGINVPQRWYR
jgi:hypothetical protein